MTEPNIFAALFKYGQRAEENYLTESFVFLLQMLLLREPVVGLEILNSILGKEPLFHNENAKGLSILTQVAIADGYLDIEIRVPDTVVYIEVKHNASLGPAQLERYYAHLQQADVANKRLVLLSRSRQSAIDTRLGRDRFHHVCWYEIYNRLLIIAAHDELCTYFVQTFLIFLEVKQMSLPQVNPHYSEGVAAILKLCDMLLTAISEVIPAKIKKSGGWDWRGCYIADFFVGIRFKEPLVVFFENNKGTRPTYKRDLDLAQTNFFSLTKDEQFEMLTDFVHKAYTEAPQPNDQSDGTPG